MDMVEKRKKYHRKAALGIGLFIVIVLAAAVIPLPDGLTRQGMLSIALLIGAVVWWVMEIMPIAVSTFLVVIMLPWICLIGGDMDLGTSEAFGLVWKEFANSVFFFVLATFALTAALTNTNIPNRIASFVLRRADHSSRKVIIGFTIGTALLSAFMSNVPTCSLFASLGISIIKANGDKKPGETAFGRALMICIPAGSVLGGVMTPAGGPTNIVVINMLEQYADITVTFLQWMQVGIPLGLIGVLIVSLWSTVAFKPEPISEEAIAYANEMNANFGKLDAKEIKTLVIIGLMFAFWIASSWIPVLNTAAVAIAGMCAFFLPGIEVITWEEFCRNASWNVLFMIGGVNALAAVIVQTGAATWLVDTLLADAANLSPAVLFILVSAICCFLHILIPSGPAVAGLAIMPMITVAVTCGINPCYLAMMVGFWGAVTYMFPMDAVPLLTYGFGYYTIKDMALKSGIFNSVVMIFVVALLAPVLCNFAGL